MRVNSLVAWVVGSTTFMIVWFLSTSRWKY
jgi:hypothetical protein